MGRARPVASPSDPIAVSTLEALGRVTLPELGAARARMSQLLKEAPFPGAFSRELFEPGHFTASAFVLSPDETSLLLIHHRKLGLWLQPGGHVEPEDVSLLEAARREVREETGLEELSLMEPCFDLDIHQIPAYGQSPAHLHFDVRALFRAPDLRFQASDEVQGAKWFPLALLAEGPLELAAGAGTDVSVRRAAQRLWERVR